VNPERSSERPAPSPRSPGLDGLRGVAALAVLLFHVWLYARVDPSTSTGSTAAGLFWSNLRWGLLLFFVLSGFLLYRPWIGVLGTAGKPDLRQYLRNRWTRILPAYYLALVGSWVLLSGSTGVPGVRLPSDDSLWLFLVFGENFSNGSLLTLDPPMWTLAVEVSFYLALPLLGAAALRLGRHRRAVLPLSLITLGLTWSWLLDVSGVTTGPLTKVLLAMLPFFGLGMLAASLAPDTPIGRVGAARLLAIAAGGLAVQLGVQLFAPASLFIALHDVPIAVAFAAIVVLAASPRSPRMLVRGPVKWLGTVSYGLYLWHVPVIWWLRSRNLLPLDPLGALAVVAPPALLMASMSWFLVERPMMAWARGRGSGDARRRARSASALQPLPHRVLLAEGGDLAREAAALPGERALPRLLGDQPRLR
jgi:peptidoglycan/LPS O-acetylase OafA/YrhL